MAPVVVMLNASQTAERLGCAIADGVVAPGVVDGIDRAAELQTGLGTVWYVLVTWPAAIIGTVAWLGVLLPVSYTHLRAYETPEHLVCRLLLEKTNRLLYAFLSLSRFIIYHLPYPTCSLSHYCPSTFKSISMFSLCP